MSCTDEMKLIIAVGHQPAVTWDDLDNMIKWLREQVDHDASHWREIAKIVGLDIDRDGDTDEDYHKQVVAAVRLQYEDVSADRKRARIALNDAHAQLTKAHAELEVARAERNDAVSCIAGWERKEAEYKTTLNNYAGIQKLLSTTQDRLDEFQGVCGDQAIQIMELRSEVASAKVNRDLQVQLSTESVRNAKLAEITRDYNTECARNDRLVKEITTAERCIAVELKREIERVGVMRKELAATKAELEEELAMTKTGLEVMRKDLVAAYKEIDRLNMERKAGDE